MIIEYSDLEDYLHIDSIKALIKDSVLTLGSFQELATIDLENEVNIALRKLKNRELVVEYGMVSESFTLVDPVYCKKKGPKGLIKDLLTD